MERRGMRTLGASACHSPFQLFQPVVPLKILVPPGLPLMGVLHLLDLVKNLKQIFVV